MENEQTYLVKEKTFEGVDVDYLFGSSPRWKVLGYVVGTEKEIREHYSDRKSIELKLEPIEIKFLRELKGGK